MADFPTALTGATDNVTDVLAKHLNNLEAKVGIDSSAVTNSIDYLLKANPDGFLINGYILPSVANNDLTVAIKAMDGNNPSATEPVYVRIGSTIRSITSALQNTLVDGTNWFNSGSAGLAAKSVDYFVYLGYNATDGVTIGFSRIPYATLYSDFSTTNTNEKYCAINVISNAAGGDNYVNIGRFSATLSATANFYWSVPTFTTSNLIQRPIYETSWMTWLPTYAAGGSMTYTSSSTGVYQISGRKLFFNLVASGTTGGTTNAAITFTLPMAFATNLKGVCQGYDASTASRTYVYLSSGSTVSVYGEAITNWGIGAGREFYPLGFYDI